jgi:6-pyruvoyltetrahydropterin/6-carboxytetrahydropterin synthase
MPTCYLTRVVRFDATHRYFRPEWPKERNAEVFGASSKEHGHAYRCAVTVRGAPDPQTGMIVDLALFDRVLDEEVVRRFDKRAIHADVAEFAGGVVPTGEMLCLDVWKRVGARLPKGCALSLVRVEEDPSLFAEYRGES